nr:short-chain dehydrogenase reductase 3a [Quercus suber]
MVERRVKGSIICTGSVDASQEQVEKISESTSTLKGVVLKVGDVANAVLFLASDDSGFVTGLDLKVDGCHLGSR